MQGQVGSAEVEEMGTQGLLRTGTDGAAFPDHASLFDTGAASLREAAAARVAAHRSKRAGVQALEAAREEAQREERARAERDARRGAANVRDAVKARYEHSQSYRDFLAAEAERAIQQAQAEAEVAARNAKAIADAQMQLLEELRQEESAGFEAGPFEEERAKWDWDEPRIGFVDEPAPQSGDLFAEPQEPFARLPGIPVREVSTGGLTVRLYDDAAPVFSGLPEFRSGLPEMRPRPRVWMDPEQASEELAGLEEEIAFRR